MSKGRLPQDIKNVPAKLTKALKIRDFLTKGATKEKLVGICLTELSQLFLCFKKYSFNQEACASEIGAFQSCYNRHVELINESKTGAKRGKMSVESIEKLLKRFPNN